MAETSKIAWTDSTFNPWIGCTKVSDGCDHCYAEAFAKRTGRNAWGTGTPRILTKGPWHEVLKWERDHEKFFAEHGRKRRVFAASMADIFDNEVDPVWRARFFDTVEACHNLNFQIVTKRIGNLPKMIPDAWKSNGMPANIGVMSTIVNQLEADRDIPKLLEAKAQFGIRWVGLSMEPLLWRIDLCELMGIWWNQTTDKWIRRHEKPLIDWIIVGGESGHHRRDFNADWARSLLRQTHGFGGAFFFKQMSALHPTDDMIPADLMVREYPEALL